MKILIIWAESVLRQTGGSAHYWGLRDGLRSIGCDVHTITPRYGRDDVPAEADISFLGLPRRSIFSYCLLQGLTLLCLPYWLMKHRPDAVYVRACFLAFAMGLFCRAIGIPFVVEVNGTIDEEVAMRGQSRFLARFVRMLERLTLHSVGGVACVTAGLREEMIRRGANPDRTIVTPNAARADIMAPLDQQEARQSLGLPADRLLVGFAGTLAPWQGLDLLMDVAPQVIERSNRPVGFALMGSGQCEAELRQRVKAESLESNVWFLGPGDARQVTVFNNACDVIVIPIHDARKLRYGCSPLKFWDGVAVGVPVIVPEGMGLDDVLAELGLPGPFSLSDKACLAESLVDALSAADHHRLRRDEVHEKVKARYGWDATARLLVEHCRRIGEAH